MGTEFEIGNSSVGGALQFNGCEIDVNSRAVELSMWEYLERLKPVELSRSRSREKEGKVTAGEKTSFRALAGTLMYLGNSEIPQAALVTSKMQQHLGDLRIKHIVDGNNAMKDIFNLRPFIKFVRATGVYKLRLVTLSDASHDGGDTIYGQSGSVCGMLIESEGLRNRIYNPLSWTSHKQRRVSYFAFGSEILAAADTDDRGYELKLSMNAILTDLTITHGIFVDS